MSQTRDADADFTALHLWRPAFVDERGYPSAAGVLFVPVRVGDERPTYAMDEQGRWVLVNVLRCASDRVA